MKELDDELRHALRRVQAPAGFADRVLRRAAGEPIGREREHAMAAVRPFVRRPIVQWAAAAAIVAAVAGGIQYRHVQNERAERAAGEAAKEQIMQALRITASKLQVVQAAVRESGS